MRPNEKEIFCHAGADLFRAIASVLDAAYVFYESGRAEEGDRVVEVATTMLTNLPEFPQ